MTSAEVKAAYPCDSLLPGADGVWFRGVAVRAPRSTTYRWLCQLRVAPYSYDLVDNRGRRSPRSLTPGADHLEAGQRVMTIFRLASFRPGHHLTIELDRPRGVRLFGAFAISYVVSEPVPGRSRLVVKLLMREPAVLGTARRHLLAWGDLAMMRRQLLTLKQLAEQ